MMNRTEHATAQTKSRFEIDAQSLKWVYTC